MHPDIGITGIDVTPEIAKAIGLQEARGFLVTDVTAKGPVLKPMYKAVAIYLLI